MIKLQDFARQQGVTDRAIQKHLKTYADELEGLYQRKGPNGTWLTDEACEVLRSKMKQQPIVLGDSQMRTDLVAAKKKIEELLEEKADLAEKVSALYEWKAEKAMEIAAAEQTQRLLTAAERDKKVLEGFVADAKAEIAILSDEKAKAEQEAREASEAAQKAARGRQKAEEGQKAWMEYAAALEAYSALGWFKRRKAERPVAPVLPEE